MGKSLHTLRSEGSLGAGAGGSVSHRSQAKGLLCVPARAELMVGGRRLGATGAQRRDRRLGSRCAWGRGQPGWMPRLEGKLRKMREPDRGRGTVLRIRGPGWSWVRKELRVTQVREAGEVSAWGADPGGWDLSSPPGTLQGHPAPGSWLPGILPPGLPHPRRRRR